MNTSEEGQSAGDGWERATISSVDYQNGEVTATLLTGPTITVPFVGMPPTIGGNAWLFEVASGAYMCMGTPEGNTAYSIKVGIAAATWSLPNNAETQIPFDTVIWKTGVWDFNSTLANAIVVPFTGIYNLQSVTSFAPNATGRRFTRIVQSVPASNVAVNAVPGASLTSDNGVLYCQSTRMLAAGARLQLNAFQNSGAGLNLNGGSLAIVMQPPQVGEVALDSTIMAVTFLGMTS